MRVRGLLFVGLLALLVGCSRPSATDCEEASRTWFTLVFWDRAEKEIADAPPEKREALRAEKVKEKDRQLEGGIELAIHQCRGARDHDFVKCMKTVNTAAEAKKCRAPKD